MGKNQSVHSCFRELAERLIYIRDDKDKRQFNDNEYVIQDIYTRGILEYDLVELL